MNDLGRDSFPVAVAVGAGAAGLLLGWSFWRWLKASPPLDWEEVGEVSQLLIYPLKSARGVSKMDAQATQYGLAVGHLEDRSFMVVSHSGNFITCRQVGTLASVVTQVDDQTLILKAKGHIDLKINLDKDLEYQPVLEVRLRGTPLPGVDCGDEAADWLSAVLYNKKSQVRLVYKGNILKNRQASTPKYFNFRHFRKTDRLYYADEGSYMVASQTSLDDLNSRLSNPVMMENFRPNIVVSGSKAYDEDDWAYVKIGQVILRRLKPCERCLLVTVDPESGIRHPDMEPLTTLKKYRLLKDPPDLAKRWSTSPIFGATMGIDHTGPIALGDKVLVARASGLPSLRKF